MTTRSALDAALARLLADALVRELRVELGDAPVHDERPAADQSDAGAKCALETRTDESTDKPLRRAS
jgi:hypothetical protein